MPQTTLNVRMDSQLKQQFDDLCNDFGMTPSTAVTIFVKALIRERRIPFEISSPRDPFYCESNMKRLRESVRQLEEGNGIPHELIEEYDD